MNEIEKLKKRLEDNRKIANDPGKHIPYMEAWVLAQDAIRLCEIYRDIAAKEGHVCHSAACKPICQFVKSVDQEASSKFNNKKVGK